MGNRLLLADDSITIRKVVGIIFADEEYELTVVDNGDAALEKARELRPDVMLVDALMPGKSGYEVCQEVRRDPQLKETPILLLVGAFEPHDEEKTAASGADQTITKPFESQQLIDRVHELLVLGKERRAAAPEPEPEPVAPAVAVAEAPLDLEEAEIEELIDLDEEIVEATIEDDLWGAFEVETPAAAAAAAIPLPQESVEAVELPTAAEFAAEEISFESEEAPAFDAEAISFEEERTEPPELSQFESFTFEPEPPAEAPISEFAPEPVSAALDADADLSQTATVAVEPILVGEPAPTTAGLTEAQLTEVVARISREVIERVVWEVVPDLAEALIKEEIRKLKAGIPG
ncbi:response regulator [Geomesophilobacter sediminis]|uniref:Response regulator n=1 Tax=Geomesophilobacter sediminis TaxID=2798584 RepID=A0A8J7LYN1_9BACT|nr:response regulator [Geomesophilobacter sediminis]MBJ6725137.1 response regulator [Geomesophilobacter sediminis]